MDVKKIVVINGSFFKKSLYGLTYRFLVEGKNLIVCKLKKSIYKLK
jgi:hypothetical protein